MTTPRRAIAALLTLLLAAIVPAPAETRGQPGVVSRLDRRSIENPQLSPDGRTIAFVLATFGPTFGKAMAIHRVDAAGGIDTPLTSGPDNAWSPRWSPDGRRLAYLAGGANAGPPQIHVLDIESGVSRQVTRHATPPRDLTWAPDSRLIFFTAGDANAHARSHLAVVDLDGVTTQITFGAYAIRDAALSPSGGTIAMTRSPSALVQGRRTSDVWVMDANGGNAHRLTTGADLARLPQVSPDGETVAFLAPRPLTGRGTSVDTLFLVSRRGGTPHALLSDATFSIRDVRWLSDDRLALLADRDGTAQLMEVDRSGRRRPRTAVIRGLEHWTVHLRSGTHVFTAPSSSGRPEIFLLPPGQPMRLVPRQPGTGLGRDSDRRYPGK